MIKKQDSGMIEIIEVFNARKHLTKVNSIYIALS